MGAEWVAPLIAGSLGLATGVTAAVITYRNNRAGATENRAPTAAQAWVETDRARARMHAFEDRFWTVLSALRHLTRSIKRDHPDYVFTEDVVEALEIEPPEEADDKK
jgi:hypothetical protein